jgi:hypothetical protein
MSISNPSLKNPCQKFIDFKSDKGKFFYYDKAKEEQIEIPLPIYFVVLDELVTISGFNKRHDCGIYSNEVRSTAHDIMRVKTFKGGESVTGLYNDVKDTIKAMGGKFTKSVYALKVSKKEDPELVNFKFKGASFSAWLDQKNFTENALVGITGLKEESNGNTKYKVPVFKFYALSDELLETAIEEDKKLQEYLKVYLSQIPEKEIAEADKNDDPDEVDETVVNSALGRYKREVKKESPEMEEEEGLEAPPF